MTEKYDSLRKKLEMVIQAAAFIGVVIVILSPLIQWAERVYLLETGRGILFTEYAKSEMGEGVAVYQEMIRTVESISFTMSKIIIGAALIYMLVSWDRIKQSYKGYLKAAIPLVIFAAFSLGIYIVTNVRGYTEFDEIPHPYIGESIYEYMRHPFSYFFCGMFVLSGKSRKLLMNIFAVSSAFLNGASMIDKWAIANKCFMGLKGSAVFNNTNHYCYYLAVAVICTAMLFIYEKKAVYKAFYGACLALGMAALISADSLGPYLAIVFTLALFAIYSRRHERDRFGSVVLALGIILVINLMLSMLVDTFISSIVRTVFDLGKVISDPSESDDAGSGRWELWKWAVEHIVRRPLVGWGIEHYEYGGTAHCEPLQYAENFGIPVTVLFIAAAAVVMVETFIKKKMLPKTSLLCFCCTFSYIVSAMFGVAIFYTTPFYFIFLGLTYAETAKCIVNGKQKSKIQTQSGGNDTLLKKV